MAYLWYTWLADEFRAAGLNVVEIDGWKTRGRPASSGGNDARALTNHHTGATSRPDSWAPGLTTLVAGRVDLPGPLCHYAVDYAGNVYVIAAGRANHAGYAKPVPGLVGGDGNAQLIGDEVITDGKQIMPAPQVRALALTNAVVLRRLGAGTDRLYRHADTSVTGKWDIGQYTTQELRALTEQAWAELEAPSAPAIPSEELMRVIQSPGRGIAVVGPGHYHHCTSTEEVIAATAAYGAPLVGNDRQFDLWAAIATQDNRRTPAPTPAT